MIDIIKRKYKSHTGCARAKGVKYLTLDQYQNKLNEVGITAEQIGNGIDDYQLCRYTDLGDYTPETCRFATKRENIEDKRKNGGFERGGLKISALHKGKMPKNLVNFISSKERLSFRLKSPNGEIINGENVMQFSRDHGLTHQQLHNVVVGKRKSHKGWTLA